MSQTSLEQEGHELYTVSNRKSLVGDGSGGDGLARLLTQTVEIVNSKITKGVLRNKDLTVAVRHKEISQSQDVQMIEDGLVNPLAEGFYPKDAEVVVRTSALTVLRPNYSSLPKLNTYYLDHCNESAAMKSSPQDAWSSGSESSASAASNRAWVKRYGKRVVPSRWCRPHNSDMHEDVPSLKRVALLQRSSTVAAKTDLPQDVQRKLSIVTHLSLERTMMLEQQCMYWPYKIAAVIYIPLVGGRIFTPQDHDWHDSPLYKAIDELEAFHARLSGVESGCWLDMEVVVEECCTKESATMYPTNAIRNRAMLLATTPAVLMLDVDFLVDLSLVKALRNKSKTEALMRTMENNIAIILPAFEAWDKGAWGRTVALEAVQKGKGYIATKFMYNVVKGFHMSHYPKGHESTDFWRWRNTSEAYFVEYQPGFEPYIIILKRYVPYFDERFRGYYWNKVEHLMHLSVQQRISFLVHPETFVVHVPHRKPKTKWRTKRSGQKEKNYKMFLEAYQDMSRSRFVPVTSFPHLCLPFDVQEAIASMFRNGTYKSTFQRMAQEVKVSRAV